MADMAVHCTSCGECVRPCSFLQQHGTPAAIAQKTDFEKKLLSAYQCSLCGLCDAVCPEGLSPSALFLAMRQEAARLRLIDLGTYASWLNYERLGSSPFFRRDHIPDGCTAVFFPGCSLPGTRPAAVLTLYELLRQLDQTTGLVLDCCGKISHDLGLGERFDGLFEKLAARLLHKGITRIFTTCPGCSKIFRHCGKGFEVTSVYELISTLPSLPVHTPSDPQTIAVHDPCPARFDQPQQRAVRQLVSRCGYQVAELPSHGRMTRCCGQGGMVEACRPGTVRTEARLLAAEAGGVPLVSSCASCAETLTAITPALHIADLLTPDGSSNGRPATSSFRRWLNRLKLKFARLS